MTHVKKYFFSFLFCGIILFVQGGFYLLHEHTLEVLSHQCTHDGEHDQTYDELCSICELHATIQYDILASLTFEAPQFVNSIYSFDLVQESLASYFELNNRGPPSPA